MLDIAYVYMDIYLPTEEAGRVKVGGLCGHRMRPPWQGLRSLGGQASSNLMGRRGPEALIPR